MEMWIPFMTLQEANIELSQYLTSSYPTPHLIGAANLTQVKVAGYMLLSGIDILSPRFVSWTLLLLYYIKDMT